ncbi:MAG TPA: LysM peptidoglycan-binding domain-containing protein [Verrucomicrobiae bacterium]|nr:LysM peptidoglycan-binding domain-containing protein [Verrucomicrobiae bacterium]
MNNPNPFVPQGSLLELQSKRRSRLKLAVFCVLALSVAGLSAMLIQGCKREQTNEMSDNGTSSSDMSSGGQPMPETTTSGETADTNNMGMTSSNVSSMPPVPASTNNYVPAPEPAPAPAPTTETYVVMKGDSFYTIAKKYGVKIKALEDANPNVKPTKLKIGLKLNIPAPTTSTPTTSGDMTEPGTAGGQTYTVKSGDTLSKIAKSQGVTLRELEAANPGVDPNHIKVGQKLNIPAAATPAPMPSTTMSPTPAPTTTVAPTSSVPSPSPSPGTTSGN